jgi:pimeloyl-ACP methyl ester carboxylesterase
MSTVRLGTFIQLGTVCLLSFISVPAIAFGQQPTDAGPRPQNPKPPFPYAQEEVKYPNPGSKLTLAGTFTKPNGDGPFPAVLMITSSGPQDRDETMAGHKPFLVIADYLTRRGIAVLRVDDRETGKSTGDFEKSTTQDFASDVEAGVRYLMTRKDVDQKHIGLLGHGEGAIEAAMVAAKMPQQIAFVVLLGGTAVAGEQVLLAQTERAERAAQLPEDRIKADREIGTLLYDAVREGKKSVKIPSKYQPYEDYWQSQAPRMSTPWLKFFLSYDPGPTLEKVQCPVLALFGSKDMQVDPEQNATAMKAAFARGGNHDATVEILPELNYMFQHAETGLPMEYPAISETISPDVLQRIGNWITQHTR